MAERRQESGRRRAGRMCAFVFAALCGGAAMAVFAFLGRPETAVYEADDTVFENPLIGFAPMADNSEATGTLRYLGISWRELEPEEGQFDWEGLESAYGLRALKEEGVHLVLRFLCDVPDEEAHLDIPDWLYARTGDGSWYDTSYGKGYSPDYANPDFIDSHARAVAALGEHFGRDGFVSYVELGSLGHWGEWHVNYGEGVKRLPGEAVRALYVQPWTEAFPNARLLMRRPFRIAADCGMGLYNDMTGEEESTREWLSWIREGGDFGQTQEKDALVPMEDFWRSAPAGGEFTSSVSMQEMLADELPRTLALLRESHMSFLGPKTADEDYPEGRNAVLGALGYRLRVSRAALKRTAGGTALSLRFVNEGTAPFYWDWLVKVYVEDAGGNVLETQTLALRLSELQPGEGETEASAVLREPGLLRREESGKRILLGIVDPMTGRDAVRLAMRTERENGRAVLFQ